MGTDLTHLGPSNHVLDGGPHRTNLFAARRGDESAMRPFVKILWPPVFKLTLHDYAFVE